MRVILFGSCKGGTGKSTNTALTAKAFAEDHKVGVFDVDFQGPNLAKILGMKDLSPMEVSPEGIIPKQYNGMKVASVLFEFIDKNLPVSKVGEERVSILNQLINSLVWGELDYLFVDLPPGTSDEVLGMLEYMPKIDGVVIATVGTPAAIDDAKRFVNQMNRYKIPIIGHISNMAYQWCGSKKLIVFGQTSITEGIGTTELAELPFKLTLSKKDFQGVKEKIIEFFEVKKDTETLVCGDDVDGTDEDWKRRGIQDTKPQEGDHD